MMKYKLFCTVTMETYYVEASSEREAISEFDREFLRDKN